jgi:hypothetical protein
MKKEAGVHELDSLLRSVWGFLLILLVLGMVTSASADNRSFNDPNDTDGPFDIASVLEGHRHPRQEERSNQLVHEMQMYEAWVNGEASSYTSLEFQFNLDHDESVERTLRITPNADDSLYAVMTDRRDRVRGYARVWRPDDRTVRVVFPLRLLKAGIQSYRWRAYTYHGIPDGETCTIHTTSPGPQKPCIDTAPDDFGFNRHDL